MTDKNISKKKEILFGDEDEDEEYLEQDNYFKIDEKNTFSVCDSEDSKNKLYKILNDNDDFIIEYYEMQKKILSLFYEKIYKTDSDPFNICHIISKQLMKSLNIHKKNIDEKLDYFINKKNYEYKYSKKIIFDKDNIYHLGYILAYAYHKFSSFKINNGKDLKNNVDIIEKTKLDVITLFYADCLEKNKSQEECSKTLFWSKNSHNYNLPGVFIFLINIFIYINTIEINFNNEEQKLTKDDVYLFILCILNIQYIFQSKITIKLNLIHEELQCMVYRRFFKELFLNTKKGNFKFIYMNKYDVYKEKWDFETEFILEKHRKNKKSNFERRLNSEPLIDDNISINNSFKTPKKDDSLTYTFSTNSNQSIDINSTQNLFTFKSQKINYTFSLNLKDDNNNSTINNTSKNSFFNNKTQFQSSSTSIYKIANNPNENFQNLHYENIISTFKKSLGLILLTIDSLNKITNMKRLDLIMNDCYKSELQCYLRNFCSSEIEHSKFHIVDILINTVRNLKELNIELNILDHITFKKILSFINYNLSMTSIKISFFSSDATYLRQTLYKIYYQNKGSSKDVSISNIVDMILPNFVESLEVLFELIKIKDFNKIAVNFDTPTIIEVNNSYMNAIFKFIMNLLFLVDNPNSRIEKLTILSTSTKFDSRILPSIENILEDINFNANNKFLNELSLQLQLCMTKNIKTLITEKLILLNIGDFDIYSFREIVKFLTSYKFSRNSSLQKMSISLLNSVIQYTNEIKNILGKIFSIKIKQLVELNIYTNIYVDKEQYYNLINIFKNNWISKCTVLLNPKSEIDINYWENGKNSDIIYLVSHCLEDKLMENNELVLRNKIFLNKDKKNIIDCDKDDNAYWIMKQIFNKKYKSFPNIKIRTRKDIIFNTLQFLYFSKNVEIKHQIETLYQNNN